MCCGHKLVHYGKTVQACIAAANASNNRETKIQYYQEAYGACCPSCQAEIRHMMNSVY
jgi:hypothetical protein